MRPLTFVLLTCVFTLAGAVTVKGNTIEFSDEDIAECIVGGGCRIVTQKVIDEAVSKIELLERQLKEERSNRCA
jgi:hypothetical protein